MAFILSAIIVYYSNVDNTINRQIQVTSAEFSGGSGTEGDPYKISTPADLIAMATNINGSSSSNYNSEYYKLMNPITVESTHLTNNTWTQIGNSSSAQFKGIFDGQGHKITFNGEVEISTDYAGLFGYNEGTIKNLGVHWNSLTGSGSNVGGIAGFNAGGTISNCYNTGSVEGIGRFSSAGGIAGNNFGTISNCYNTGSVKGTGSSSYAGGIAAYNSSGTISNCYNTGSVTGSVNVGGIAGYNSSGTISNCYNTSSVTGTDSPSMVGGIVGMNFGTISNCYNTGSVTGTGSSDVGGIAGYNSTTINNCFVAYSGEPITIQGNTVGGVVGYNDSTNATITNCYYDSGITLDGTTKNETGKTTGLNNIVTDTNQFLTGVAWDTTEKYKWDFETVWTFAEVSTNPFPVLQWQITDFTYQINNDKSETKTITTVIGEKITLQSPEELGYTYDGYEFLYWTDSDDIQYSAGGTITITQDITLTAQWEQAKSTIDFTITNNTGDTVLVVFKYNDSIATFRVVGDISATSGVTKNYSFKVAPQSGCVIYIIGGSYTTTLTVNGTPSTPSGNSYTIDCSNDVTMTLTIG